MESSRSNDFSISLWSMILQHIAPNEIYEVKSFLGEDLVDQSIELRTEIETLLEIYEVYSKEKAAGDNKTNCLPEPPELRHRLMLEIQFFVQSIRDQARSHGRNPDLVLNNHRSDIIDYAYESASSRPLTSDTSLLSTSRSSYRVSPVSDRLNVNLMKDKLNYMAFDEVQANLKMFLQEEVEQLHSDLLEIQSSLYNDDTTRCQSRLSICNQPTISELKKERHDLEQILLQSTQPLTNRHNNNQGPNKYTAVIYRVRERERERKILATASYTICQLNQETMKALFKLLPDGATSAGPSARLVASPPRLKPIDAPRPSYEESPLDLGLPETASSIRELIGTNNSSSASTSCSNSPLPHPPTPSKPRSYNSAQKFRQKVLQNRKESCN